MYKISIINVVILLIILHTSSCGPKERVVWNTNEVDAIHDIVVQHVITQTSRPISFHMQNPVNPFIGRKAELTELKWSHLDKKTTAIVGPIGVGKTELARKYAQEFKHDNISSTIWIDSESVDTIIASFKDLAVVVGVQIEQQSIPKLIRDVIQQFNPRKTLFIFDNAKSDSSIIANIPNLVGESSFIHIIITSRDPQWNSSYKLIHLNNGFIKEEAVVYLKTVLKTSVNVTLEDTDIDHLLNAVGYLPLTLSKVTEHMARKTLLNPKKQYTVKNFLKELENEGQNILQVSNVTSVRPPTEDELEDFLVDRIKHEASEIWEKTANVGSEVWDKTSDIWSKTSNAGSEVWHKVSDGASVGGKFIANNAQTVGKEVANYATQFGKGVYSSIIG